MADMGLLEIMDGNGRTMSYPTYTCGHCSRIVVMRYDRVRPRQKCFTCGKMVCDQEICHPDRGGCTPLSSLANDHFEGAGHWARRVRAIMRGATTLAEENKLEGEPNGTLHL